MPREVLIDDVACCDCGGVVTMFGVPDAVWDGLGFTPGDFACMGCVGKRLNPKLNSEHVRYWIEKEIWRQRRQFKLVGKGPFTSMKTQSAGLVTFCSGEDGLNSVPKAAAISRGER